MDNTLAVVIGLAIGLGVGLGVAFFIYQMRSNQKLIIMRNAQGQIDGLVQS